MRTTSQRHGAVFAFSGALAFVLLLPAAASAQKPGGPQLIGPPAFGADTPGPRDVGVGRARNVSIAFGVLDQVAGRLADKPGAASQVTLPLFDGASAVVQIDRLETMPDGSQAFTGHIAGDPLSSVTIIARDGLVSANFNTSDGKAYQIRFRGAGVHELREMDYTQFKEHALDAPVPPPSYVGKDAVGSMADDGSIIDVMVLYTPAARTAAGGTATMQSLVNLGIAETNSAYANSNVIQRVRLVYTGEVAYTEAPSADLFTDLNRLTLPTDGYIDEVHTLRNTYGADIVSLWVETPATSTVCGVGWIQDPVSSSFASSAFDVVSRVCATGYYSFGHEMGHNMGLRHDTYMDPTNTPYPYGHGYVDTIHLFRTVMGYNNACGSNNCTRIQYFSNPSALFNGYVTGDFSTADNHTVLNNTRVTVANFRSSVTTTTPPAAPTTVSPTGTVTTATPTYTWNASAGSASYTLLVQNTAAVAVNLTMSASAAGCPSGGTCTATPPTALTNGAAYNWFVNAINSGGTSAWSAARAITVGVGTTPPPTTTPPSPPTLISPSGNISALNPTYSWNAVYGADSYYLLVQNTSGVLIGTSYPATSVGCGAGTGTCSVAPATSLVAGSTYNWFVSATNSGGTSAWSTGVTITVTTSTPPPNLWPPGCVVPNTTGWSNAPTGSTTGWSVATDSYSEGSCSLKASPMASSSASGSYNKAQIQFTGNFTTGNITFDRRVVSEPNYDCLQFFVDGVAQSIGNACAFGTSTLGVSGNAPWASVSVPISAGSHTVTWSYEKDFSVDAAGEGAWIDNLVMPVTVAVVPSVPTPRSPDGVVTLTLPTFTWDAASGATSYQLQVQNTSGVAYSLTYTPSQAGCASTPTCSVTPGTPLSTTLYNWFVNAASSAGTSAWSTARTVRVDPSGVNAFPAGCALPTSGWINAPLGATTGWSVASDFSSEGTCSLKSNPMSSASSGVNKAQIQFIGTFTAGNVMFDRKVSSENNWDCLRFLIDGVQQSVGGACAGSGGTGASGEVPFGAVSVPISAGSHTLTWSYEKDTSVSMGYDAAWIDNLVMPIGAAIPSAPTTVSPSGTITTATPAYTWSASANATTYSLLVQNTAGAAVNASYTASAAGCGAGTGTCTITPSAALTNGSTYNWFVNAANASGTSAWSAARSITVAVPTPQPPPAPVTVSPSGNLSTNTPAYTWNASTGATSYMLLVQNTAGALINTSYAASAVGCPSGGTCSVTPSVALASGATYNWFVNATNANGTSAWSAARTITAPAGTTPPPTSTPPAAPTQVAPSGTVTTTTPTYSWSAVSNATSYYLQVQNTLGVAIGVSYTPSDVGCGAGTGTCSVTPATALANGSSYAWFVNGSNAYGTGPWSAGLSFNVTGAGPSVPLAPVTVSPSGSIATTLPTYTWNASAGATAYYLLVQNTAGVAVGVTYSASTVGCGAGTGTCSVTPGVALTSGASYNWFVNASNSLGTSPWSAASSITVSGGGGGGGGVPAAPTLIAPSGNTGSTTPVYSWNASAGATSYYLLVQNTAGVAVGISYSAAAVGCSTGTGVCSVQPAGALASATSYNWFVNATNSSGTSAWSSAMAIRTP